MDKSGGVEGKQMAQPGETTPAHRDDDDGSFEHSGRDHKRDHRRHSNYKRKPPSCSLRRPPGTLHLLVVSFLLLGVFVSWSIPTVILTTCDAFVVRSTPQRHRHRHVPPLVLPGLCTIDTTHPHVVLESTGSSIAAALARTPSPLPLALATTTTLPTWLDGYVGGQYAFMFPIATVVATSCQLAGIGGAALFSPIFLLVFPLLGPDYPLASSGAALASALLTECFGFSSGLSGFARRGLVDWGIAGRFLVVSVPTALLGAIGAKFVVGGNPALLQSLYALLMLGLAVYLTLSPRPDQIELLAEEECALPDDDAEEATTTTLRFRSKIATDGTVFDYRAPAALLTGTTPSTSLVATMVGGSLTGLLGVGIGEVVLPQLVRSCCMPLPVAAGTSVAIVVTTALTAATVQFLTLAAGVVAEDTTTTLVEGLVAVVPWNLVCYTIPGVLLGGQLAPFLASRGIFDDEAIENFAIALFGIVGLAFATKVVVSSSMGSIL